MRHIFHILPEQLRTERGTATVEFVIWFPVFLTLFLSTIQMSFFGMQSVLLERAVDLTVRDLRLGISRPDSHAKFKEMICDNMLLNIGCERDIAVELRPISVSTWNFPADNIACVDRANEVEPYTDYRWAPQKKS